MAALATGLRAYNHVVPAAEGRLAAVLCRVHWLLREWRGALCSSPLPGGEEGHRSRRYLHTAATHTAWCLVRPCPLCCLSEG